MNESQFHSRFFNVMFRNSCISTKYNLVQRTLNAHTGIFDCNSRTAQSANQTNIRTAITNKMEGKRMEIFILFRQHLAVCGIIEQQIMPLNSRRYNFNFKNSKVIAMAILFGAAIFKLIEKAKTFEEYAETVSTMIYIVVFLIFYTYTVWKTSKLFGSIKCLEDIINKSKLQKAHFFRIWMTLENWFGHVFQGLPIMTFFLRLLSN